jgi:hypothetical protein
MSDTKGKTNISAKQQTNTSAGKYQLHNQTPINRRRFLSGIATMTTLIGSEIVFARFMP